MCFCVCELYALISPIRTAAAAQDELQVSRSSVAALEQELSSLRAAQRAGPEGDAAPAEVDVKRMQAEHEQLMAQVRCCAYPAQTPQAVMPCFHSRTVCCCHS